MSTALLLTLVGATVGSGLAVVRPAPAVAAPDPVAAGAQTPDGATEPGHASAADRLQVVSGLVVRRLALAEPVAESKWLSGAPIVDPAREQAVVDAGVTRARAEGVDPDLVGRVLRDQIAASKLVQRGLFTRWTHEPWSAPVTAPDLAAVRAQITQIDDDLVDALGGVEDLAAADRCAHAVVTVRQHAAPALDPLQRKALHVAWSGFCGAAPASS